jgi:hypothetical protein
MAYVDSLLYCSMDATAEVGIVPAPRPEDRSLGHPPRDRDPSMSVSRLHIISRPTLPPPKTRNMAPQAVLSHLHRADGSATYSQHGYTIIGAVNGPIEVLKKDEMPLEATVEVNVRPAVGVGSTYSIFIYLG